MRINYADHAIGETVQKAKGFSKLHSFFCDLQNARFVVIRDSIEDIWDMVTNKDLLHTRLKSIANKNIADITAKNCLDMALISAFLWNDTEDTEV